ncbi:MAG: hypothetical protein ACRC5M_04335 [Anaeroplasmataceae bacterium]
MKEEKKVNQKKTRTKVKTFEEIRHEINDAVYKIDETGELWVTGRNDKGQLGLGHEDTIKIWTKVESLSHIKLISFEALKNGDFKAVGENGEVCLKKPLFNFWVILDDVKMGNTVIFTSGENIIEYEVGDMYIFNGSYFIIDVNRKLWVCGVNTNGALGLGHSVTPQTVFVSPLALEGVKVRNIYGYINSYYLVDMEGHLWVTGVNSVGELGVGNTTLVTTWTKPPVLEDVIIKKIIDMTNDGSFKRIGIVDINDRIYYTGQSLSGELGLGGGTLNTNKWTTPTQLLDIKIKNVENINADANYSIDEDGSLWFAGINNHGEAGQGHVNPILTFSKIYSETRVINVIDNGEGCIILDEHGIIRVTGINADGQQGTGNTTDITKWTIPTSIKDIKFKHLVKRSGYGMNMYAIDIDDELWVTGLNTDGQLGIGNSSNKTPWIKCTSLSGIKIKRMYASRWTAYVIDKNDKLWVAGYNADGRIGTATTADATNFTHPKDLENKKVLDIIVMNETSVFVIDENYKLYVSGTLPDNTAFGLGTTTANIGMVQVQSVADRRVVFYKSPANYLINLLDIDTGEILTSGKVEYGALGLGTTLINTFTVINNIENNAKILKTISNGRYNFFITEMGEVYTSGINDSEQLGVNIDYSTVYPYNDRTNRWFRNKLEKIDYLTGKDIEDAIIINDNEVSLVDKENNVYKNIDGKFEKSDEFSGNGIKQILINDGSKYIIDDDGFLWVVGKNDRSQLGLGHSDGVTSWTKIDYLNDYNLENINITRSGKIFLNDDDTNIFMVYNLWTNISRIDIEIKEFYNNENGSLFAIDKNEDFWVFGQNENGELGVEHYSNLFEWYNTKELNCDNHYLGLFTPPEFQGIIKQSFFYIRSSYIIDENDHLWVCGKNNVGQLGLGDTKDVHIWTQPPVLKDVRVKELNTSIISIYSSSDTCVHILDYDGCVWACGDNRYDVCDTGGAGIKNTWVKSKTLTGNKKIVKLFSTDHNLVFSSWFEVCKFRMYVQDDEGKTYGIGHNGSGYLGVGTTTNPTPNWRECLTPNDNIIKEMKMGLNKSDSNFHWTLAIDENKKLLVCGANDWGQLGTGAAAAAVTRWTLPESLKDVQIDFFMTIGPGSCAIDVNGVIYVTGYNHLGQLGTGNTSTVTTWTTPLSLKDVKVVLFKFLNNSRYLIDSNKKLWVTGENGVGHLGVGTTANNTTWVIPNSIADKNIEKICINHDPCNYSGKMYPRAFVITEEGELFVTGENTNGECGIGTITNVLTWTKPTIFKNTKIREAYLVHDVSYAIDYDNNLWVCGNNTNGVTGLSLEAYPKQITTWTKVANGMKADRMYFCIGDTTTTNKYHTAYVIDVNKKLWVGGVDLYSRLGKGRYSAKQFFQPYNMRDVEIAEVDATNSTVKLTDVHGGIWICGKNGNGQIGIGTGTTDLNRWVNLNSINTFNKEKRIDEWFKNIDSISMGYYHSFILDYNDKVWVCGRNVNGQLGIGNKTDQASWVETKLPTGIKVKSMALGSFHSFILDYNDKVWVCGSNYYGQLGIGNKTDQANWVETKLPTGIKVKSMTLGSHSFILDYNDKVWVCGNNVNGQLGIGNKTDQASWVESKLPTGIKVKSVVLGLYHSFILDYNNKVWACGSDYYGQLGIDNKTDQVNWVETKLPTGIKVKSVVLGHYHSFILDYNNKLWVCGRNGNGQLGVDNTTDQANWVETKLPTGIKVKSMTLGSHSFILDYNDKVWVCGRNENGQLGIDNKTDQASWVESKLPTGIKVKSVVLGSYHSFILDYNDKVWVCGRNENGQLGIDNKTDQASWVESKISDKFTPIKTDSYECSILSNKLNFQSKCINSRVFVDEELITDGEVVISTPTEEVHNVRFELDYKTDVEKDSHLNVSSLLFNESNKQMYKVDYSYFATDLENKKYIYRCDFDELRLEVEDATRFNLFVDFIHRPLDSYSSGKIKMKLKEYKEHVIEFRAVGDELLNKEDYFTNLFVNTKDPNMINERDEYTKSDNKTNINEDILKIELTKKEEDTDFYSMAYLFSAKCKSIEFYVNKNSLGTTIPNVLGTITIDGASQPLYLEDERQTLNKFEFDYRDHDIVIYLKGDMHRNFATIHNVSIDSGVEIDKKYGYVKVQIADGEFDYDSIDFVSNHNIKKHCIVNQNLFVLTTGNKIYSIDMPKHVSKFYNMIDDGYLVKSASLILEEKDLFEIKGEEFIKDIFPGSRIDKNGIIINGIYILYNTEHLVFKSVSYDKLSLSVEFDYVFYDLIDIKSAFGRTYFIFKDGHVMCSGHNECGALGTGNEESVYGLLDIAHHFDRESYDLTRLSIITGGVVKDIAIGLKHTVFLLEDGRVFGFGDNSYSQLGGRKDSYVKDFKIMEYRNTKIQAIKCTLYGTILLGIDEKLIYTGTFVNGELGLYTENSPTYAMDANGKPDYNVLIEPEKIIKIDNVEYKKFLFAKKLTKIRRTHELVNGVNKLVPTSYTVLVNNIGNGVFVSKEDGKCYYTGSNEMFPIGDAFGKDNIDVWTPIETESSNLYRISHKRSGVWNYYDEYINKLANNIDDEITNIYYKNHKGDWMDFSRFVSTYLNTNLTDSAGKALPKMLPIYDDNNKVAREYINFLSFGKFALKGNLAKDFIIDKRTLPEADYIDNDLKSWTINEGDRLNIELYTQEKADKDNMKFTDEIERLISKKNQYEEELKVTINLNRIAELKRLISEILERFEEIENIMATNNANVGTLQNVLEYPENIVFDHLRVIDTEKKTIKHTRSVISEPIYDNDGYLIESGKIQTIVDNDGNMTILKDKTIRESDSFITKLNLEFFKHLPDNKSITDNTNSPSVDDIKLTLIDEEESSRNYTFMDFMIWLNGNFINVSDFLDDDKKVLCITEGVKYLPVKRLTEYIGFGEPTTSTLLPRISTNNATVKNPTYPTELRWDVNMKLFGWKGISIDGPHKLYEGNIETELGSAFRFIYGDVYLTLFTEIRFINKILNEDEMIIFHKGRVLDKRDYTVYIRDGYNTAIRFHNHVSDITKAIQDVTDVTKPGYASIVKKAVQERIYYQEYSIAFLSSNDPYKKIKMFKDNKLIKNSPTTGQILFDDVRPNDLVLFDGKYVPHIWVSDKCIRVLENKETGNITDFLNNSEVTKVRPYLINKDVTELTELEIREYALKYELITEEDFETMPIEEVTELVKEHMEKTL